MTLRECDEAPITETQFRPRLSTLREWCSGKVCHHPSRLSNLREWLLTNFMPTLHLTPLEVAIIIDALSMPAGVTSNNRPTAETLRLRLKHQMCYVAPPTAPRIPIKSAWPDNPVTRSKKVSLPKATKPKIEKPPTLTVEDILEGLV